MRMDRIGNISWWLSAQKSLQPDTNNDNNNFIPFYAIMVSVMDESDYFDEGNDKEVTPRIGRSFGKYHNSFLSFSFVSHSLSK